MLPKKLQKKLEERKTNNSLRELRAQSDLIDFSSNDYLGFSKSKAIYKRAATLLKEHDLRCNGATGSRLLTGNHALYRKAEEFIANFHESEAALIYNSGYDANVGFFSSVPQRDDLILFDELCHASIRDGIRMSAAKAFKFKHNDLQQLQQLLAQQGSKEKTGLNQREIYVVTESIFSMDGDAPDLNALVSCCNEYDCKLILDEAHAVGVCGENGAGLVQQLQLSQAVFARIITFGKALGCHGAAVLCNSHLKSYLVNFSRSFIYSTALPPHSVATILAAYEALKTSKAHTNLQQVLGLFRSKLNENGLSPYFIESSAAIHSCVIQGNEQVKQIALQLQNDGFDIKPIMSPTVPKGQERLRICLHSYTTESELNALFKALKSALKNLAPIQLD